MTLEDQRLAVRDAFVAQELGLVGLPVEEAHEIAEACEDYALAGMGGFMRTLYLVINSRMQYGHLGPVEDL